MKNTLSIIFIILIVVVFGVVWKLSKNEIQKPIVTNFEECVEAGNPVMESYPRQCKSDAQSFTENIGNELEKANLIRIDYPRPNQTITSPLVIKGQARGYWFFEASFPVVLTDWDGKIITQGIATAKNDWMTTEFVPYEATLTFTIDKNIYSNKGTLVLHKDNPSGLPENDDVLEIPIIFSEVTENSILPFESNVTGKVLRGPICPVMKDPPEEECADQPVFGIFIVKDVAGINEIARFSTQRDGSFTVTLPAGEYSIESETPLGLPGIQAHRIEVRANETSEYTIVFDTGIR
jgi:hypothetical protein